MKKYLRVAVVTFISLICLLTTSLAAETAGTCGENLSWYIEGSTLYIEGFGPMYDYGSSNPTPWYDSRENISWVSIADGVTSVGSYAFDSFSALGRIALPESITTIGSRAFYMCGNLAEIDLPEGLKTIGSAAFERCSSLTSITIPHAVTALGSSAFYHCSKLQTAVIGDGVTVLDRSVFYYCENLKNVTVGSSVTTIGDLAFYYCQKLEQVTLCGAPPTIAAKAFDYVTSYFDIRYPFVYEDGYQAIKGDYGSWNTVTWVPVSVSGTLAGGLKWALTPDGTLSVYGRGNMPDFSAVAAPWHAFRSYITSVVLGPDVYYVGAYAFSDCTALTEVTMGVNFKAVGPYAFRGCTVLKTVNFLRDAPLFTDTAFWGVTATCRYYADTEWKNGDLQDHGGDLTWQAISSASCHSGWTAWNRADSLPTTSGNYYLTQDVTLTSSWTPPSNINLCLDGYAIMKGGETDFSLINIGYSKENITLTNCESFSEVRYGYWTEEGGYVLDNEPKGMISASHVLTGGLICGGRAGSSTSKYGGAIYSRSSLTLENITVAGNYATYNGGAVYLSDSEADLTIRGCRFVGNHSSYDGGGVYADVNTLTVTDSVFESNQARQGGAMSGDANDLTVRDCQFSRNIGSDYGGACQLTSLRSGLVQNCSFLHNMLTGTRGGGLYYSYTQGNGAVIDNCVFWNNCGGYGGGVNLFDGIYTLTNCLIENNTAAISGGGIQLATSTVLLENTSVLNNRVDGSYAYADDYLGVGGGICIFATADTSLTLRSSNVSGNSSTRAGGGIGNVAGKGVVTIHIDSGCVVTGNTAGGAMSNLDVRNNNADKSVSSWPYPSVTVTCAANLTGACVGVTAATNTAFTSGYSTTLPGTDPAAIFSSDLNASTVILDAEGEVMVHKHTFRNYVSNNDATCTADGTETGSCSSCGSTDTRTDYGTQLPHSFTNEPSNSIFRAADCENAAVYYVKCDNCSAVSLEKTVSVGKPNDHIFGSRRSDTLASEADCDSPAQYYVMCNFCDAVSDTATVPYGGSLGHDFTDLPSERLATAPSCTAPAMYYVLCNRCDAVSADKTVAVGEVALHSFIDEPSNSIFRAADCENAAVYYVKCDNCSAVSPEKTVSVGNSMGHSFTKYQPDGNATYITDGTETATCDRCEETDTRTIPGTATGPGVVANVQVLHDPETHVVMLTNVPAGLRVALAMYEDGQQIYISLWENTSGGYISCVLPSDIAADNFRIFFLTDGWYPIGQNKRWPL